MPTESEVKDRLLRDIQEHELTVIRDDGVYRHLRFKKPGTSAMYFDLITWPGHLCFTGDMGSYLFSRVRDMFKFFRDHKVNPQYWSEKVLARDREGVQQWSGKKFRDEVSECVHEYFDGDPGEREKALEELSAEVLPYEHEEWEAVSAFMGFRYEGFEPDPEIFSSCYEYTFRFLWCCHALVWAIQQYDEQAEAQTAEEGVA